MSVDHLVNPLLLLLHRRSVLLLPCRVLCRLPRWKTSACRVSVSGILVTLTGITLTSVNIGLPRHLFSDILRIICG